MPTSRAKTLSPWARSVWEECRRTKLGITAADAKRRFGEPPGNASSGALLERATRDGWFRQDRWQEETHRGFVRKSHYVALPEPEFRAEEKRESWFDGIGRCSSVFDYAEAIGLSMKG